MYDIVSLQGSTTYMCGMLFVIMFYFSVLYCILYCISCIYNK